MIEKIKEMIEKYEQVESVTWDNADGANCRGVLRILNELLAFAVEKQKTCRGAKMCESENEERFIADID